MRQAVNSGRKLTLMVTLLASVIFVCARVYAQGSAAVAQQMSTEERLGKAAWWPTKGVAPPDAYAGTGTCAKCHSAIAESQKQHSMAWASAPAATSKALAAHLGDRFSIGSYKYAIERGPNGEFSYTTTDGSQSVSNLLGWAFGRGKVGQSYMFEKDGAFYEVHFSYFSTLDGFDITPNQTLAVAGSLEKAVGRRVGGDEVRRCFGCHSTEAITRDKFDPKYMVSGVSCEGCHGPGADHAAAAKSGMDQTGLIVNSGHMSPADSVDFCGSCHGTWWDVKLSGSSGIANIRFPPYRLEKSRCWGTGDARITCIACHDPHQPLARDAATYDRQCLSCHATQGAKQTADHPGAACPKAVKDCVSCHMPKYEVPQMHFKYTDHYIRVVRETSFPD